MSAVTFDPKLLYQEVTLSDLDSTVIVGFTFRPGYPGRHTLSNGDPGYPDEPAEVEVSEVWVNGANIVWVLMERHMEELADKLLELSLENLANQRNAA